MSELVRGLPPLLASHLELVLIALIAAVLISMPLAILVADRPRLALPVVTIAGVIQTIPGLALLALMVAIVAGTGGLGIGLAPFGFPPAVIALTLYAILPILRNAITGLRGVEIARQSKPDVILMDINLPGLNGFDAMRILAADARTSAIPVIAISANAMPHDLTRGLHAGFFRYLTKPINVQEFMDTLDAALKFLGERESLSSNETSNETDP